MNVRQGRHEEDLGVGICIHRASGRKWMMIMINIFHNIVRPKSYSLPVGTYKCQADANLLHIVCAILVFSLITLFQKLFICNTG